MGYIGVVCVVVESGMWAGVNDFCACMGVFEVPARVLCLQKHVAEACRACPDLATPSSHLGSVLLCSVMFSFHYTLQV